MKFSWILASHESKAVNQAFVVKLLQVPLDILFVAGNEAHKKRSR